jgi:hypothetical protein
MRHRLGSVHPRHYNVPRTEVSQGVFLDWDRTLGVVDKSVNRLYAIADSYGIDTAEVRAEYKQSKQDGGSAEPLSVIERKLRTGTPRVSREELRQKFVNYRRHSPKDRIIYPDAAGLVSRIHKAGAPDAAVTFGVSERWQAAYKIPGGGYEGYVEPLTHSFKGLYATELLSPNNTFDFYKVQDNRVMGIVMAETVAQVDDKVISLENGPKNFTGFLLRRPDEEVSDGQKGEWPAELTVASLGELVMQNGILTKTDEPALNWPPTMPHAEFQYVPINYAQAA